MSLHDYILLISPHGRFKLKSFEFETIADCLWRYRIPLSSIHLQLESESGIPSSLPISCLNTISNSSTSGRIVCYLNRNIEIPQIALTEMHLLEKKDFTTEWVGLSRKVMEGSFFSREVVQFSQEEIIDLAIESIRKTFEDFSDIDYSHKFVLGFSGGGDSNLLLTSLLRSGFFAKENIYPVMVSGIPDWDLQAEIATKICSDLDIDLKIINQETAAQLVGVNSIEDCLVRFKEQFPNTGSEFFGTWLIRKVLGSFAMNIGCNSVILGLNREDILAESLFLISTGKLPLPFPVRRLGDLMFISPLYLLPKKLIDGAFPSYSLVNYRNRQISNDTGRSVFYYLANLIQDTLPGLDLSLINGMQEISSEENIVWNKDIQDFVFGIPTNELISKWQIVTGSRNTQS